MDADAVAAFDEAMNDDFNTPKAFAVLFDLARRINSGEIALAATLKTLGGRLGILQKEPSEFLKTGAKIDVIDLSELITNTDLDGFDYYTLQDLSEDIFNKYNSNKIEDGDIYNLLFYMNSAQNKGEYKTVNYIIDNLSKNILNTCKNNEMEEKYINLLLALRQEAKSSKNYNTADYIRAELAAQGIIIKDTADGVEWRYE